MEGDEQQVLDHDMLQNSDLTPTNGQEPAKPEAPITTTKGVNLVYLTGPVQHHNPDVASARIEALGAYAKTEAAKGEAVVLCPSTHWSQFGDQSIHATSDTVTMQETFAQHLRERCHEVLVLELPGWQNSKELQREIAMAEAAGMNTKRIGLPDVPVTAKTVQNLMAGLRGTSEQVELAPGFYAEQRTSHELTITTDIGEMTFDLDETEAPTGVANLIHLATQGFYNGTILHRVIKDHSIQGGCPNGDGTGTAGYECETERTTKPYKRGTLALSSPDPGKNSSQWFIVLKEELKLDQKYTVIGNLTDGSETLSAIEEVSVEEPDSIQPYRPKKPITITDVKVIDKVERVHTTQTGAPAQTAPKRGKQSAKRPKK